MVTRFRISQAERFAPTIRVRHNGCYRSGPCAHRRRAEAKLADGTHATVDTKLISAEDIAAEVAKLP